MEFAHQLTIFADAKRRPEHYGPLMKQLPRNKAHALLMFYIEFLAKVQTQPDVKRESLAATVIELLWYGDRQRYYKVWPAYLKMFQRTRLDLPARVFQSPSTTFTILLPKGQTDLVLGTRPATSIMLTVTRKNVLERAMNQYANEPEGTSPEGLVRLLQKMEQDVVATEPRIAVMCVWVAGENGDPDPLKSNKLYYRMNLSEESLLQDMLKEWDTHRHPDALQLTDDEQMTLFLNDCFRVALSVSFLATGGDRAIDPDILSSDIAAYIAAVNAGDDETIARLQNKAVNRRGEIGYTLGREDLLGRRRHPREEREEQELAGRELQFQHLRNAHFHLFWTGEGRKTPRVRFLRPTIVRDDLPAPVDAVRGTTTPHE